MKNKKKKKKTRHTVLFSEKCNNQISVHRPDKDLCIKTLFYKK